MQKDVKRTFFDQFFYPPFATVSSLFDSWRACAALLDTSDKCPASPPSSPYDALLLFFFLKLVQETFDELLRTGFQWRF
jgi:hypothetical protein